MSQADRLIRSFGARGLLVLLALTPLLISLQGQVLEGAAVRLGRAAGMRSLDAAARAFAEGPWAAGSFLEGARGTGVVGGWLEGPGLAATRHALPEFREGVLALPRSPPATQVVWSRPAQTALLLLRHPAPGEPRHPGGRQVVLVMDFGRPLREMRRTQGLTGVLVVYSLFVLYAALHFLAERAAQELEASRLRVEAHAQELEDVHRHLVRTSRLTQLGELAASVAHEVKNPLASLSLGLQVLRGKLDEDHPGREDVRRLLEACDRLDRVVRSMLRFSRPEGDGARAVDLGGTCEKVAMLLRKELKDREISLELRPPPRPMLVLGDPVQLEQVVMNLVFNARDAAPPGSTVTLEVVPGSGGRARIRVRDRGRGLEGREAETLFEPFRSTKGEEGTGLGLAISRRIARAHGGDVSLVEAPGEPGVWAEFDLPEIAGGDP